MEAGGRENGRGAVGGRRDPSAASAEGGMTQARATKALAARKVLKNFLNTANMQSNLTDHDSFN